MLRVNGKMANPTVTHRTVFKLIGRGQHLATGMTFNATIQPTFMLPNTAVPGAAQRISQG
jgi:hypothetical protein